MAVCGVFRDQMPSAWTTMILVQSSTAHGDNKHHVLFIVHRYGLHLKIPISLDPKRGFEPTLRILNKNVDYIVTALPSELSSLDKFFTKIMADVFITVIVHLS